jgi:hypothetical protein
VGEGSPVLETQCAEPCSNCCINKCPFGAGATCSCDGGQTCGKQEEKKIIKEEKVETAAPLCSNFNVAYPFTSRYGLTLTVFQDCPGDQVCCSIIIEGDEGEPGKNTRCVEPCSDCCLNKCPNPGQFITCSCDGGETCGKKRGDEVKLVKQDL